MRYAIVWGISTPVVTCAEVAEDDAALSLPSSGRTITAHCRFDGPIELSALPETSADFP
jgi:hypothetical protein